MQIGWGGFVDWTTSNAKRCINIYNNCKGWMIPFVLYIVCPNWEHYSAIFRLSFPHCKPISALDFPLSLYVLRLNFPLLTLPSKQS